MKLLRGLALIVLLLGVMCDQAGVRSYCHHLKKGLTKKTLRRMSAHGAICVDVSTGQVLFEKNSKRHLSPASLTKMMTALLTFEALDRRAIKPYDTMVVSRRVSKVCHFQIKLRPGTRVSVIDALKGALINSSNGCAIMLAEKIAGTEQDFVKRMNKKARELGMINTHFNDCSGLDQSEYSCAYDIAILAQELLNKYPRVLEITSKRKECFGSRYKSYGNTNQLLSCYRGMDGLKTGWTPWADFCLCTTAHKDDVRLVTVVIGCKTSHHRYAETMVLLDDGFKKMRSKKRGHSF
jgi:D-alanyl-D-alanine carboxypeptidase (penicillin-binding protein 5/6)